MSISIFVSHCSKDSAIVEKFVDGLVGLGIDSSQIFYTSGFQTGVRPGLDIPIEVKKKLKDSKIIMLMLSQNYYSSPYCMNEAGAAWIMNDCKVVIPILMGLQYGEMVGFIGPNTSAIDGSNPSELQKVITILQDSNIINNSKFTTKFDEFANGIKEHYCCLDSESSDPYIVQCIMEGRFSRSELAIIVTAYKTQSEILIENEKITSSMIGCLSLIDEDIFFQSLDSLSNKGLIEKRNSIMGTRVIAFCNEMMQELLHLNDEFVKEIEKTFKVEETDSLQLLIKKGNLNENAVLLLLFIKDTNNVVIGKRWMSQYTIELIQKWEKEQGLGSSLSMNYENASDQLINRNLMDVVSITSFGNPREYKLSEKYQKELDESSELYGMLLSIYSNSLEMDS